MNPERVVEIKLWDWFINRSRSVEAVYFNSKNEVMSRVFTVKGKSTKKPDLIIKFMNPYTYKKEYMAIKVKDASKSGNVRKGTKVFSEYFLNYIKGKTKYFIKEKEIKISHFAIATQFSEEGHLTKNETLVFNETLRGKKKMENVVPRFEFSQTKEIHRGMITSYSKYRNDNNYKKTKLPSVGVIISNVLQNFDKDELERQPGTKGMPIYQAITFNEKKWRWSQCLMKI